MLRGLIRGATTAAGVSAIVLASASLIAPTSPEAARRGAIPSSTPPGPPEMALAERSAPSRPEAMPERVAVPEQAVAAEQPIPAETRTAADLAIPAGSQFNRPREDFQPVAPDAGEVARGFASAPGARPAAADSVAAPSPDTSSGSVPEPGLIMAGVAMPKAGEAPALPAFVEERAPQTFRDTALVEDAPEASAEVETVAAEPAPADAVDAAAPDVQEQVAVPSLAFAQSEGAEALVFVDAPAPGAEAEEAAPTRIVPRRIVLDSERDRPAPAAPATEPSPAPEDEESAADAPADARALWAHAAPFENGDDKPLFAIILIDDPAGGMDRSGLATLGLPITFAIDPARADAAEAARTYRDAGYEVLMLADGLSAAGAAQDIEIALTGAQAVMPEAVGVLDSRQGGFARNRNALASLVRPLSEAGMGFVGYDEGLGTGLATAARAGVLSAPVYRVVDEDGERATVITRFLDRATFEAAQDGSAIVVGRTGVNMVTALLSWASGRRADTVALAPVSHVLKASDGES
ncbi:divergent polysaccharide deacetylase family protein [Jannaschia sp.]|nr:divergent polysaccharide deacetylase family protein [Jannaschia sp.]